MTQAAKTNGLVLEKDNLPAVDLEVTDKALAKLKAEYEKLPDNLADSESYRLNQDAINNLRSLRSKTKSAGKQLKDDANAWIRKVTGEEKRIDAAIVEMLDPIAQRKKTYDDEVAAEKERKRKAEQARKDTHLANINGIRILISKAQGKTSAQIETVIEELEAIVIDDSFEEFQQEAQGVYDDTDFALRKLLVDAQYQEDRDRKRIEEDARLKREREALEKQRQENERVQRENERIAEENRKAAEAAQKKEAEPVAEVEAPAAETAAPVEQPKAANVSPAVQQRANEDNSVVAMARKNTLVALEEELSKFYNDESFDFIRCAEDLLAAIQQGKIPNVKYDIY